MFTSWHVYSFGFLFFTTFKAFFGYDFRTFFQILKSTNETYNSCIYSAYSSHWNHHWYILPVLIIPTCYVDPRHCAHAAAAPRYMTHDFVFVFYCFFMALRARSGCAALCGTLQRRDFHLLLFYFFFFALLLCLYSCAYNSCKWFVSIIAVFGGLNKVFKYNHFRYSMDIF